MDKKVKHLNGERSESGGGEDAYEMESILVTLTADDECVESDKVERCASIVPPTVTTGAPNKIISVSGSSRQTGTPTRG